MLLLIVLVAASPRLSPKSPLAVGELVPAFGPLRPQTGAWVEYLVRSPGEEDVRLRIAVLPPALADGRAWIEVATLGSQSLPVAARVLVNTATGTLERALVYALGQAPIEVPVEAPQATTPLARHQDGVVRAGAKTIRVPAGTFAAAEGRVSKDRTVTRVWRTDEVPLWGLVRAESRHQTVELLRYGHAGARIVFPPLQGNGSESAND